MHIPEFRMYILIRMVEALKSAAIQDPEIEIQTF